MFESSAGDINKYIEEKISPTQQLFDLDDVYDLVKEKLKEAKTKEANELLNFVADKDSPDIIKESDLIKAFQKHKIDTNNSEIKEMLMYINQQESMNMDRKELSVSSENFKNFYIDN